MKLDWRIRDWRYRHQISLSARLLAWAALGIATAWLLRAEAVRAELPKGVIVSSDLVYREVDGYRLRLDVYEPEFAESTGSNRRRPAILAIHGGGWRGGSKSDYGRSLLPLVRSGFVLIAVDYRLSRPRKPSWPGNLDDLRSALSWVQANSERFGIDRGRIALMGASAGGHLALLLGEVSTLRRAVPPIRAVIDFYGPTDLDELRRSVPSTIPATDLMIGGTPEFAPDRFTAASPIHRIEASHPPTLMIHGTDDLMVPASQSIAYADRLQSAGVRNDLILLSGIRHGFGLQVGTRDLLPEILRFLEEIWG